MPSSGHAFVGRVRLERRIVRAVNRPSGLARKALPGLGPAAIEAWIERDLHDAVPQARRAELRRALLDLSALLRWHGSASHRGIPPPESREIPDMDERIEELVALAHSLASGIDP